VIKLKAVIVQPFYLPWMGYFGMIDASDIFVFADDVQFQEKSWQQRNKIKNVNNKCKWLTVPVNKNFGQMINETTINNSIFYKKNGNTLNWKEKHWDLISLAYSKAPYFDEYKDDIQEIFTNDWDHLPDLDIYATEKITELLRLKIPHFVKKTEMEGLEGRKVDSIMNICDIVGADGYISGLAAEAYINYNEFQKFKENNVDLYWFEFPHPVYPQIGNDFIPFLSAIDLLFNTGKKSRDYIRKSLENSLKLEDGTSLKMKLYWIIVSYWIYQIIFQFFDNFAEECF